MTTTDATTGTGTEPAPEAPASEPKGPVTVLYVGGCGRSGSTLLDRMLGALPGFVAMGEVVHLIERGLIENEACGCGQPFRSCEFWAPVVERTFGTAGGAEELRALQQQVDRNRYIGRLRAGRHHAPTERYNVLLGRLYRAIADQAGARVVVDSSKHASTAFLLRQVPGVDLKVVHLVRDSRGMAYSWTKAVARPEAGADRTMMHQHKPSRSAARWMGYNSLFHLLGTTEVPVTRVIYEDLVVDPRGQLDRILDGAGIDVDRSFPFLGDGWVELGSGHSVAGNPMRFNSGRLELRVDSAWREKMPPKDRRTVTALTAPLLAAYGYLGRKRR